ncbi:MAG: DUF4142 domain-containing protein [Polyangiaceae bacterium]|nr:DUF4142 domain-containing protein [Polyangiaceae bacterium]
MSIGSRAVLTLTLAVGVVAGCTSDERTAEPQMAEEAAYTQPQPAAMEATPATPSDTGQTAMTEQQPAPAPPPPAPMTEEQIFAVLDAANAKEIDEAKAVVQKSKNKDVKAFATMMVTHHTDAKTKGTKLAKKLSITPDASFDKSNALKEDTTKQVETLKAAQGADLDKAFVDLMIADHKAVLELIDTKLLVDAKNEELKAHIQEIRPVVEKHLKDAEALQMKLSTSGAGGGKAPAGTPGAAPNQPGMQPGAPGMTPKEPAAAPGASAPGSKPGGSKSGSAKSSANP